MKTVYRKRDYAYGAAMLKLRTKIGLTQGRLGSLMGVSWRAVAEWEAGISYPKTERLKALIELAVQRQAFTVGHEAEEIRVLWNGASQKVHLEEDWLAALLLGHNELYQGKVEIEVGDGQAQGTVPTCGGAAVPTCGVGGPQYTIQNLPFPANPFFTGREDLLKNLEQLFESNERAAITQLVSVSGLGGIGKTQLALEYAHRCYPNIYQYVFFVNAVDRAALEASYLSLAHILKLPDEQEREIKWIIQAVNRWLEQHGPWLLIFDNADDLELVRSFLPIKPRGHILLTTCSQIVGDVAALLQVEAMSPQEGLFFLLRRSGVLKPGAELHTVAAPIRYEAERLVELLAGHPLALDQAGAYIEETTDPTVCVTGASFTQYCQFYQQHRHLLLKIRGSLGGQHPASVATTIDISIQKACELHPRCSEILAFCSLLHPDAIPEELFRQETELSLCDFNDAMRGLRRYSLIKRDPEKKVLSVHRLVQAVIRESMDKQTWWGWATRVVRALNEAFPEGRFEVWNRCEQLLPHVRISANWIERFTFSTPEAAHLLDKTGTYLRDRGQYGDAEVFLVQALTIREEGLGVEHPDTAISLNNLAILYRLQGKYEQAELLFQRALAIREEHLEGDHPGTLETRRAYAALLRLQGRDVEAAAFGADVP